MTKITLSVADRNNVSRRIASAFRGENQGAFITFDTVDLLWRVLTKKRWEILQAMTGEGAMSVRSVARKVGRDVKAVHADVTALAVSGVIERSEEGFLFPYSAVHVDFTLTHAA